MKVIGIGGYICSGKSYLCSHVFKRVKNSVLISADNISREAYKDPRFISYVKKNAPSALSEFGVDRRVIINEIMINDNLNREYSELTWEIISDLLNNIIKDVGSHYDFVFIEAALISQLKVKFDIKIWVEVTNVEEYRNRILSRGEENTDIILKLLEFQKYYFNNNDYRFDFIIDSSSDKTSSFELRRIFTKLGLNYDEIMSKKNLGG